MAQKPIIVASDNQPWCNLHACFVTGLTGLKENAEARKTYTESWWLGGSSSVTERHQHPGNSAYLLSTAEEGSELPISVQVLCRGTVSGVRYPGRRSCSWCFLHTLSTSVLGPAEDLDIPLSLKHWHPRNGCILIMNYHLYKRALNPHTTPNSTSSYGPLWDKRGRKEHYMEDQERSSQKHFILCCISHH